MLKACGYLYKDKTLNTLLCSCLAAVSHSFPSGQCVQLDPAGLLGQELLPGSRQQAELCHPLCMECRWELHKTVTATALSGATNPGFVFSQAAQCCRKCYKLLILHFLWLFSISSVLAALLSGKSCSSFKP